MSICSDVYPSDLYNLCYSSISDTQEYLIISRLDLPGMQLCIGLCSASEPTHVCWCVDYLAADTSKFVLSLNAFHSVEGSASILLTCMVQRRMPSPFLLS